MQKMIETINNIFANLIKHPDRSNELSVMIRDTLNSVFADESKYAKIHCKRVFISDGNSTTPYNILVIPDKPDSILKSKFLTKYDIDIDLTSFIKQYNKNGLTPAEMTAWLIHELAANIFTDETFLRFKKLIIKHYDTKEDTVLDSIDSYGNMLWIGAFSRTSKLYSTENSEVNTILNSFDLGIEWDNALSKFISSNGGDHKIITQEYIDRMDKVQLKEFNKLARKYSSFAIKYNNTDYSTMVKYIMSTTHSELVKYYIEKEPQCIAVNPEKVVYYLFDDRKILLEDSSTMSDDRDSLELVIDDVKTTDLLNKYNELIQIIPTIECESDKLLYSVKAKELSRLIDKKFESDTSSDILQQLKFDMESLLNKITNIEVSEEVSVIELE